uniref:hypothetical protein n=1 Tax=Acinetobacter gerneri TaxID=202952 RepID=UPI00293BD915|nr:hypothetical protein [Acinetobacter gerneri]
MNIRNKTSSDIGLVNVGFNLNGCILGLTHTDEWMEHLFHLVKFITDSEKREKSRNFLSEQDKIKEQKVLEKQAKEKEREVMIQQVEDLTNTDDFKLCKTKGEILLFWERTFLTYTKLYPELLWKQCLRNISLYCVAHEVIRYEEEQRVVHKSVFLNNANNNKY